MGAYSGVGAYLSSSGSEVGAYSGGGLIRELGLNRSFTVINSLNSRNSEIWRRSLPGLHSSFVAFLGTNSSPDSNTLGMLHQVVWPN